MSVEEARAIVIARCKEELHNPDVGYMAKRNILNFLERDITQRSFCQLYKEACVETIERIVQ